MPRRTRFSAECLGCTSMCSSAPPVRPGPPHRPAMYMCTAPYHTTLRPLRRGQAETQVVLSLVWDTSGFAEACPSGWPSGPRLWANRRQSVTNRQPLTANCLRWLARGFLSNVVCASFFVSERFFRRPPVEHCGLPPTPTPVHSPPSSPWEASQPHVL